MMIIKSNRRLGLGLGLFYFILNTPSLTRDVTCSRRKKYEEEMPDEQPLDVH